MLFTDLGEVEALSRLECAALLVGRSLLWCDTPAAANDDRALSSNI